MILLNSKPILLSTVWAFVCLFMALPFPAFGSSCAKIFALRNVMERSSVSIANRWERVAEDTQPTQHDPNKFAYIVHALPPNDLGSNYNANEIINLWKNPQDISKKVLLSTSLISDLKRGTYRNLGFILRVPPENIVSTHSRDSGTNNHFESDNPAGVAAEITRLSRSFKIKDPEDLIETSDSRVFNEVVVTGTSDLGSKIEIAGVFVVVDKSGNPLVKRTEDLQSLIDIAKQYALPVVPIETPWLIARPQ